MQNTIRLRLCIVLVALFATFSIAQAQTNAGFIRGTVTDSNNAAVAGANVSLRNAITNYTQRARTNSEGAFQLLNVPFNSYVLTVEANGFDASSQEIEVASNILVRNDVKLSVGSVKQQVDVNGQRDLLDVNKTASSTTIDRTTILDFPTSQPSRSAEKIIATAPGFTLDANNRIHSRGIEYQIQYSIDGIPITDTIASTFSASPDPRNFRSVEVTTSDIPAEYGNKLAGIVAVTSRSGLEIPTSGSVTYSGGSFNTQEVSFDFGGHAKKFGYYVSGAASKNNRFLDPPSLQNFHNKGAFSGRSFFNFDYTPTDKDFVRFNFSFDGDKFQVPNLPDQEEEGQDQRRRTSDNSQAISWQHTFSPDLTSFLAFSRRYNSAKLFSNELATPVFAEQSRHNSTYDLQSSLTYFKKRNTIKAGFDYLHFPLKESFTFAITDLEKLLEMQPDLPEDVEDFTLANPFLFNDKRTGNELSFYLQDHINATKNLTFNVGARFDHYQFLVTKNFVSPRLGVAYRIDKTKTVVRASYNRFMETPALENLLLSSSARTRIFSPAEGNQPNFAPVRPSDETQFDVGFQQQIGRYVRLDSEFYVRRLKNQPEISNFLETGIIFPANVDRNRSRGIENRLDVARFHGFSGFVSYTNFHIYGFAPITGGLFLGEAIDKLGEAGERIQIEEDQRNTVAFQARYDLLPHNVWFLFTGRHDSGYSVELEPGANEEEFMNDFPEKILEQVNFEKGYVRPHTTLNLAVGKNFDLGERFGLTGQFNVENFTNKFYLTTFESVFSGTTIGRPRSYSGRLTLNFK